MRALWLVGLLACGKSSEAPHEDRHEARTAPSKLRLEVTVGGVKSTWNDGEFAAVAKMTGAASDGEARDTWSLRELVKKHVGSTARVVAVTGEGGAKRIDEAAWNDQGRIPIVHVTKRGALKFRWSDPSGKWEETSVKDVTAIDVVK